MGSESKGRGQQCYPHWELLNSPSEPAAAAVYPLPTLAVALKAAVAKSCFGVSVMGMLLGYRLCRGKGRFLTWQLGQMALSPSPNYVTGPNAPFAVPSVGV